jgi:signal transduction histidine kinase
VIDNLTTNALKYGAAGGRVVLRASSVEDQVRIEVVDFGPGLSLEKQAQLFEPFNRLGLERSSIEGHGVGLAIAKRLVELQGGAIGVVSAPGQGATFWLTLPHA